MLGSHTETQQGATDCAPVHSDAHTATAAGESADDPGKPAPAPASAETLGPGLEPDVQSGTAAASTPGA